MSNVANILIVVDEPATLHLLEAVLSGLPVQTVKARSDDEALTRAEEGQEFAAILLDVVMPGMDGFETAARLRQLDALQLTPILFLSARDKDQQETIRADTPGVVDYIFKPIIPEILRAKVEVFLQLFEPIRQLKRQENELRRSNQDLQQFAYVASHDLQEPLRMVANFTQLLAQRYQGHLDAQADKFIEHIVDGATRMQRLIRDLLTYARAGNTESPFESTNLGTVLQQTITDLEAALHENGADVTYDALPTISANPSQMQQLFQNLLENALKFRSHELPRICVSTVQEQTEWVVAVRDNGIGIDPQYAEHIFAIFQRLHTRTEYPGTGIGLAICKKIVERHGGRI